MKINKLLTVGFWLLGVCAFAQNQQLEEKLMALKQNQAANKHKLAQIMVGKENDKLRSEINRALERMANDGTRRMLLLRWFGEAQTR